AFLDLRLSQVSKRAAPRRKLKGRFERRARSLVFRALGGGDSFKKQHVSPRFGVLRSRAARGHQEQHRCTHKRHSLSHEPLLTNPRKSWGGSVDSRTNRPGMPPRALRPPALW